MQLIDEELATAVIHRRAGVCPEDLQPARSAGGLRESVVVPGEVLPAAARAVHLHGEAHGRVASLAWDLPLRLGAGGRAGDGEAVIRPRAFVAHEVVDIASRRDDGDGVPVPVPDAADVGGGEAEARAGVVAHDPGELNLLVGIARLIVEVDLPPRQVRARRRRELDELVLVCAAVVVVHLVDPHLLAAVVQGRPRVRPEGLGRVGRARRCRDMGGVPGKVLAAQAAAVHLQRRPLRCAILEPGKALGGHARRRSVARGELALVGQELDDAIGRVYEGDALVPVLDANDGHGEEAVPVAVVAEHARQRHRTVDNAPAAVVEHEAPARQVRPRRPGDLHHLVLVRAAVVVVQLVDEHRVARRELSLRRGCRGDVGGGVGWYYRCFIDHNAMVAVP